LHHDGKCGNRQSDGHQLGEHHHKQR
jgi:hypothetical protein